MRGNASGDIGLSQRAKLFALEYVKDRNGKAAATRAGFAPRSAAARGSLLLKDSRVWQLIDAAPEAARDASVASRATDGHAIIAALQRRPWGRP
jgi:phage terminase small subunit